ncbi:hypothetical protein JGS22_003600 [Streptomyces sp. P38-E01]|uniref:Uncharacterized protein n=1 Tax=Streptomyces tardus TaxID=2780544 RepID=A0A949JDW5_9ACTN|nr:hypothetical protein [Streptomyces tardus]MBU7596745.1 hypothetical protein [Streptomyces tardus]
MDDEAAENLLRGSVGDGASSCPSPSAQELAGVLDGLAESHRSAERSGELPGEAEALAAFRTARTARAHDCRGGRAGARSRRGRYMTRVSGTPLHVGFAMAIAGFALGGVAVAASNGVLPAPFGGGEDPGASGGRPPAVEPLESESPYLDNSSGGNSDRPDERLPGWGSPSERGAERPGGSHRDIAGALRGNGDHQGVGTPSQSGPPADDSPSTWPHRPDPDGGSQSPEPDNWPPTPPSTKPGAPDPTVVVALCRAYEGDKIEHGKRWELEQVAGGPEQVESYCEEYGDVGGGGGGTEGGDSGNGGVGIPEQPDEPGTPTTPGEPGDGSGGGSGGGAGGAGGPDGPGDDTGGAGGGGAAGGATGGGATGGSGGGSGTGGNGDGGTSAGIDPGTDPAEDGGGGA